MAFIMYKARNTIPKPKDRMRRRRKIYSTLAARRKTTYIQSKESTQ
jgi:hypothetical protein